MYNSSLHVYAAALLIACATLPAAAQSTAERSYQTLRLPVSAHAAALGGDNVSLVANDATLTLHNPALLSAVSSNTLALGYMNYIEGAKMAHATYGHAVDERATWAASAQYVDFGKMQEVDENNVSTGTFSARDICVGGHFSYLLTDRLAGGLSARMISSTLGSYNSLAFGVDLGANYYDADRELSVSLVAKNLGGQLDAYDEEFEKLPFEVLLGLTKQWASLPLRLSLTVTDLNHLDYKFTDHLVVGGDVLLSESFWVGGGYNWRRAHEMRIAAADGRESSHGAGLSLGAGLNLQRVKLNVAWAKYHVSASSLVMNAAFTL